MTPTRWPLILLLVAATAATASSAAETAEGGPPTPTAWPKRFHAMLFSNLTSSGGKLQMTDLYYDWPRRRNMNLVRRQLSGEPLYDVEWGNGTSFYFDSAACRTMRFPVGVLHPGWLTDGGAVYLGCARTGGIDCHVWGKEEFIWYYEDVLSRRPVRWNFYDGIQQYVMGFEVGVVLEDSQWQAPAHCFPDDEEIKKSKENDYVEEAPADGLEGVRRL